MGLGNLVRSAALSLILSSSSLAQETAPVEETPLDDQEAVSEETEEASAGDQQSSLTVGLEAGLSYVADGTYGASYDYAALILNLDRFILRLSLYKESFIRQRPEQLSVGPLTLEGREKTRHYLASLRWGYSFFHWEDYVSLDCYGYVTAGLQVSLSELLTEGTSIPLSPHLDFAAGFGIGTDLTFPFSSVTDLVVLESLGVGLGVHASYLQQSFEPEKFLSFENEELWILTAAPMLFIQTPL